MIMTSVRLQEMASMLKKIDNTMPESSEYKVAIVVTPNKTVAACVCTLNAFGELDNFPYTGRLVYRDANGDCWIDLDGEEVLPFDLELLEVKES